MKLKIFLIPPRENPECKPGDESAFGMSSQRITRMGATIGWGSIILFFILLGIIFSYPLISNFNSTIPYAYQPAPIYSEAHLVPGDHLLLYYTYWLLKDFFQTPGQNFFREPYTFSIQNWQRPYEPRELPSSLLFLLFSFLGNAAAYNTITILSFLLSGIFAYLLSKKYLGHTFPSLVSGIIFVISPFRLTQLFGGHPTGFILFWLPLIVYLYELLWEKRRWIFGWLAGIFIFFMCMEEHHMGYYTALFTIVFWLYKFCFLNKKKGLNIVQLILLTFPIFCGWVASGIYMMYIKTSVIGASITSGGRSFAEIRLFSPYIKHIFQRINPDGEKCIYIGIISGILCLAGIFKRFAASLKGKGPNDDFPLLLYFLTFFVTLILSIGPNFTYFPLYKICYKIIPFFYFPRATARIFMYTLLALSILSGYGLKTLLELIHRNKKWMRFSIATFTILLLYFDFHTYPKIGICRLAGGNKTYDYAKKSYPHNPLLEIPLWPGESSWTSIYQYYTTIYRIPIINGYSPFVTKQYIDEIFWPLVSLNMGMINEEQYNLLKKLNIKYINLHEEAYPQKVNPFPFKIALENLQKSPFIKFMLKDGPMYLFHVLDESSDFKPNKFTIPSKTGIFYECECMPRRIGEIIEDKYASSNKSLYAKTPVSEPTHLVFGPFQLFPPGRYKILFRVKLSGENPLDKIATLEVTTDNGKKRISGIDLQANDEYRDYILNFTLDKLTILEFRIIYYGKGQIYADYVYLLCEEENDPVWYYNAKDLFHIGREKDGAVYAAPELDPPGDLIFGPYRRYPEGKYRIGFKLKVEGKPRPDVPTKSGSGRGKSPQQSAILKVSIGHNDKPLAEQSLQDIDTEYKTYWITVSLDKPTVLEFKVEYLNKIPIYVDSVKVEPVS